MTLRDDLDAELVNCGGWLLTRAECVCYLVNNGVEHEGAVHTAYAARRVTEAQAARWDPNLTGYVNAVAGTLLENV